MLTRTGPVAAIIIDRAAGIRPTLQIWRRVFIHLEANGFYVARAEPARLPLAEAISVLEESRDDGDSLPFVLSEVAEVSMARGHEIVRKKSTQLLRVTDDRADELLLEGSASRACPFSYA